MLKELQKVNWDKDLLIDSQIVTHKANIIPAKKFNKIMALIYNGVSVSKFSANLHEVTK